MPKKSRAHGGRRRYHRPHHGYRPYRRTYPGRLIGWGGEGAYPVYAPFISSSYMCDPYSLQCGRSTTTGEYDCVCTNLSYYGY